jgi:hypothetical protein
MNTLQVNKRQLLETLPLNGDSLTFDFTFESATGMVLMQVQETGAAAIVQTDLRRKTTFDPLSLSAFRDQLAAYADDVVILYANGSTLSFSSAPPAFVHESAPIATGSTKTSAARPQASSSYSDVLLRQFRAAPVRSVTDELVLWLTGDYALAVSAGFVLSFGKQGDAFAPTTESAHPLDFDFLLFRLQALEALYATS